MHKFILFIASGLLASVCLANEVRVGETLPRVVVESKGEMVFDYKIENNRMVSRKGTEITYRTWDSGQLKGKIRCIYHLAARMGISKINQPFIDALIAARLPEFLPDGAFKTTTILDTSDALWGTATLAGNKLEDSQLDVAHAYYVNDTKGLARSAWGLPHETSTVILLDAEGRVLYHKEGKMSKDEINRAVAMIRKELAKL